MKSFEALGVQENILTAIKKIGFYDPTPIQAASIPLILQGKDIIAGSNTGSGKTFAFAAGIIQKVETGAGVQALILVPTRELAEQMLHAFKSFCKKIPVKTTAVYGGVSLGPQFKAIVQSEIVIGTPGRILDHLERKTLELKPLKFLVLDEADRMLDMGFLPDVTKILKQTPRKKQILLYSATMPNEVKKLAQKFMQEPEHINLAEQVDPTKLAQETYMVNNKHKQAVLKYLLKKEEDKDLSIIFCNTRSEVDNTAQRLKREKIKTLAIHGGLSQNQRLRVIKSFTTKNNHIALVCTDVAARGLDIPGITHVYNYDLPREPKQYLHRIGRTARAGADGKAINLVSQRDLMNYKQILRSNTLVIPLKEPPEQEQKLQPRDERIRSSSPHSRRTFGDGRSRNSREGPRQFSKKGPNKNRRDAGRSEERSRDDKPKNAAPKGKKPFSKRTFGKQSHRKGSRNPSTFKRR